MKREVLWTEFCKWLAGKRVVQETCCDGHVRIDFDDGSSATVSSDQSDPTPGWSEVTPGSDGHLLPPTVTIEEP